MAGLVGKERQTLNEPTGAVRRVKEKSHNPSLPPVPRWMGVFVVISVFATGFFVVAALFVAPGLGPTPAAVAEAQAEVAEIEATSPTEVAAEVKEEVSETFSVEDAEKAADAANNAAIDVISAQIDLRAAKDDESREAAVEKLATLLAGSPTKAVAWYSPRPDVSFTWSTFAPYLFVDDAKSESVPCPRVLWLATGDSDEILAWAHGVYDTEAASFKDVEYGLTEAGQSLLGNEEGKSVSEITNDQIRSYTEELSVIQEEAGPVPQRTQEERDKEYAAREAMRERMGATIK